VNTAVSEMDKVTQQTAANAEESAAAAEEMNAQAQQMKGYVEELAAVIGGGSAAAVQAAPERKIALAGPAKGDHPSRRAPRSGAGSQAKELIPFDEDARGEFKDFQ
jgi:methyl-accepting chemotaxis protein